MTPLFVGGVARSATTQLATIFATHPRIVLGMERFKKLWGKRIGELTSDLLTRERFFDFSDGFTNLTPDSTERWATHYAEMADKFDTARYVGDKLTVARPVQIWKNHPEARQLFIVRDVAEVASSWDVRAHNAEDRWSADRGAEMAVEAWNTHVARIVKAARDRPDRAAILEHRRFYGDPTGACFRAALAWLDLDEDPAAIRQFEQSHKQFALKIDDKDRSLPPEAAAAVERLADPTLWSDVTALTL